VKGRQGQSGLESELGGLGIVGVGEGTSEVLDGVTNARGEDDRVGVSGGMEEIWKALATMQVRQGVMEKELNTVRIEVLVERLKVGNVGELASGTEERVDGLVREFGEYGGRRDKMESRLKYITELEGDMREVFGQYGSRLDKIESGLKELAGVEKDTREEMGRSNEGGDLLSVAKGDQGEQGGEGACVGGRGVLYKGPGRAVNGGDRVRRDRLSEEAERQSRRLNLVFMGIKEGSAVEDEKMVRDLVRDLLVGEQVGIRVGERVGRKGDKVRPIRVVVEDAEQRRRILARAKGLGTMVGREGVFIAPDRTPRQQGEDKILRDKVKVFRSEGKEGVKISKGEVVVGEGGNRKVLYSPGS